MRSIIQPLSRQEPLHVLIDPRLSGLVLLGPAEIQQVPRCLPGLSALKAFFSAGIAFSFAANSWGIANSAVFFSGTVMPACSMAMAS